MMRITIKRRPKYILRIKKFKKENIPIIIDGEIEYYYSSNGTCYFNTAPAHILIFSKIQVIKLKLKKIWYKIFYFDRNSPK